MKTLSTFLILLILALANASTTGAQEFYKGKTIQFIISSSPGGGLDVDGRIMARYLGRMLPGSPTVVPQNMPGAGSIRAADFLYFTAPKDGTAVGVIDPGVYNSQMVGEPRIRFDAAKQRSARTAAKNSRLKMEGLATRRASHTIASGKRSQARRDKRR